MSTRFHLLTRDQFREQVFARDGHACVVCRVVSFAPFAFDAHHIIERRLWPDSGYYLENGVTVCGEHHLEAERTTLSCERLRELAGITEFPLPDHLCGDQAYDKWGDPILPNGLRLRGELFHDPSVQKILAPVLALFTDRVKYPRTYHLPWSPGVTNDDRVIESTSGFEGKHVVVTVKMDGECTSLYSDYLHARSIEYDPHPSRSWVKALHARIAHDIPAGYRVCGENLYAKHSIEYRHLEDYFQVFSVWNDRNICLNWDDTIEWASLLGLKMVPVLLAGLIWDEPTIRGLHHETHNGDPCEGYVVRLYEAFHYKDFRRCAAKFVRARHVQTREHWMHSKVEPNQTRNAT